MALQPISSLVGLSVRRAGIEKQALAAQVFERFKQYVTEKFGAPAVPRALPKTLTNGRLMVEVSSSALWAELKTHQSEILDALNKNTAHSNQAPVERLVLRIV